MEVSEMEVKIREDEHKTVRGNREFEMKKTETWSLSLRYKT